MAAVVAALALIAFVLGYRFYARFIGTRIYGDTDRIEVPAQELADGRDYVATNRHILFGHHFTSIAGAAPIIGPCVAAFWGWLPAVLWVVLGTIFMGAVHDFGALVVSVREKGRSIADVTAKVVGGRARLMFLSFVAVVSWLVLAVFAMAIAGLFVAVPSSVLPVNIEIVVAIVIGWLIYKRGVGALVPSLVGLGILYFMVWVGVSHQVDFQAAPGDENVVGPLAFGWSQAEATNFWILALFAYSAVASLLPVWLLLQPRDFINSHQLIVGLGLLYCGLFFAHPDFDAPMIRAAEDGAPSLFPLLFVTIACGAISGFHGLVSSGTTSKQISSLSHARSIGYGAMLGEGSLAVASAMAAVAGIGLVGACNLRGTPVEDLSWAVYYSDWASAGANKAAAFVLGGGQFLQEIGLPGALAQTLMAVLVISFAATTLDTATRIERLLLAELGAALRIRILTNPYVATAVAIGPAIALAMLSVTDPATGQETQAGWVLWPIFGASNQMLAALTLMVISIYFWKRGRPVLPLVIPMLFVMAITFASLLVKIAEFYRASNWLLFGLSALLLALILWMILEGASTVAKLRAERA